MPPLLSSIALPEHGVGWEEIEAAIDAAREEDPDFRRGRLGIFSLRGDDQTHAVAQRAYAKFFGHNALFAPAVPSIARMQRELLSGWAAVLGAPVEGEGVLTSGGTDSIFSAVHTMREHARERRRDGPWEIVAPRSAHAAFTKACHYLGLRLVRVPLDDEYRVDLDAVAAAINDRTVGLVASAPTWPHGVFDPVTAVGDLAAEHDLWLHVDACVGGCLAPFARELGYPIPPFGFEHPRVYSMSVDLHKYGYAPKPCSALFYASHELARHQGFATEDWSTGRYATPSFVGTRPGGAIAGGWAVTRFLGHEGYLRLARTTMSVRDRILDAIDQIPDLYAVGSELSLVAFGSDSVDIRTVVSGLRTRGWSVLGVAEPELIHVTCDPVDDELVAEFTEHLREVTGAVARGELTARGELRYT